MRRLAAALALIAPLSALPAAAETPICGARQTIVEALARQYGEAKRAVGLHNRGALVELWTSADTGSWTLLLTRPDGVTCAMAAGESWREELHPAPAGAPT
jgi:hypothetical protein